MKNRPEDRIEVLGLSKTACSELRRCHIDTVQDLMILINEKLTSEKEFKKETPIMTSPNHPFNISLGVAIPEVLKTIKGTFDLKIVRDKLRKKYGKRVTTKKSSIKIALNKLLREEVIERTGTGDFICVADIKQIADKTKLDKFLDKHIGKDIEFRYKTERHNSDKRWRSETVWAHDEKYLYVRKQYLSGRHVFYSKERIVDFREKLNTKK